MWWPGLDAEIEDFVGKCPSCIQNRADPPATVLGHWEGASRRWQRVHIDYAGPFQGRQWLVWIDAHTKFAGASIVKNADSASTIRVLREVFGFFGVPDQIVSDKGTPLVSEEFSAFLRSNGVRHIRSAPYHPQTNGEAERFVQTLKKGLRAEGDAAPLHVLELRLQQFLLSYRTTQHATTRRTPAQIMMGFQPTTLLDRLRPSLSVDVEDTAVTQGRKRIDVGRLREIRRGSCLCSILARHEALEKWNNRCQSWSSILRCTNG